MYHELSLIRQRMDDLLAQAGQERAARRARPAGRERRIARRLRGKPVAGGPGDGNRPAEGAARAGHAEAARGDRPVAMGWGTGA